MKVLEPSAGDGTLADMVMRLIPSATVDCIEIQDDLASVLRKKGYAVIASDFLACEPNESYELVVMNPPFQGGQDVKHVTHAMKFLEPGGTLAAVMSAAIDFRTDNAYREFNELLEPWGSDIRRLPNGAFSGSGTDVATCLLVTRKP